MKEPNDAQVSTKQDQLSERVPIGLSMQWPLIQIGRSMRNMVGSYRRFFTISNGELKDVYQQKADRADDHGDVEGCLGFMEKVVSLAPNDVDALYNLGLAHEKAHDNDQARQCYEKVVELRPEHAKARFRIGMLQLRGQKYDEAVETFGKAVEHAPDSPDVHFRLGQAYDRLRNYSEAIAHFDKAVELDAEYLPAFKNMALTYDSMNKHKKALECLKRALELEELAS